MLASSSWEEHAVGSKSTFMPAFNRVRVLTFTRMTRLLLALPILETEVDDGALELSPSDSDDLIDEVEDGVHLLDGF